MDQLAGGHAWCHFMGSLTSQQQVMVLTAKSAVNNAGYIRFGFFLIVWQDSECHTVRTCSQCGIHTKCRQGSCAPQSSYEEDEECIFAYAECM